MFMWYPTYSVGMERNSAADGSEDEQTTELTLIGLKAIRSRLRENGLDVDDDGFIIDMNTGELMEPYTFSLKAYENHENPSAVEDPLSEFCYPETDCSLMGLDYEKVHLTDLHTIYTVDGRSRPIRDDMMALSAQFRHLGMTYDFVCEWSSGVGFVRDLSDRVISINISFGESVTLNCFHCDFSGDLSDWSEEYTNEGIEYRCPDCTACWNIHNIQTCTSCQNTFRWEEIVGDDPDASTMHWSPSCPNCDADMSWLHTEDRYSGHNPDISLAEEPVIEEPESSLEDRHFEKAKTIDNQLR